MKAVLLYLFQVIIASGILYGYYHLALRNKLFHQYNRFYLLTGVIISILAPFLNIPVYFAPSANGSQVLQTLQNISFYSTGPDVVITASSSRGFDWRILLYASYSVVILLFVARVLISLRKIRNIIKRNPVKELNGVHFVNTQEPGTPYSFFRWLFWNKKIELDSAKGEQIFRHEIFHIRQKHSLDIIFMELLATVFWINPFFHLIKKELKAIHEFLADRFASHQTEKWEYAELLLMQALNTRQQLVNPFFNNQIKRRIAMITNPQKTSHRYLRKLLVLPVAAIVVTLFAFKYKQRSAEPETGNANLLQNTITPCEDTIPPEKEVAEVQLKQKLYPDTIAWIKETNWFEDSSEMQLLIVIDGVVIGNINMAGQLDGRIKPDDIQSINVYKGADAVARYGDKGKNGVIEIITKKNKTEGTYKVIADNKLFEKVEEEPAFPGGATAWRQYLQRNLNPLIPVDSGAAPGNYTVFVQFIVHADGSISDIKPLTKHGFGMEKEVVKLIKNSPNWIPGKQNGKTVNAYRKQPVTFVIEEEIAEPVPDKKPTAVTTTDKNIAKQTEAGLSMKEIDRLSPIYPNPASNDITISLTSAVPGKGQVIIADVSGNVKIISPANLVKGANIITVNIASLTKGTHTVFVVDSNQKTIATYKLMKL